MLRQSAPNMERVDLGLSSTEQSLLSCLLIRGSSADNFKKCRDARITAEIFTIPEHAELYQRIEGICGNGVNEGIVDELERELTQERSPLLNIYISATRSMEPTSAFLGKYIRELKVAQRSRDFRKIAKDLSQASSQSPDEQVEALTRCSTQVGDLLESNIDGFLKLEDSRLKLSMPPPEAIPRIFLAGKPIATPANLVSVISKAKTGKTASVGAIIAAAIVAANGNTNADTLKFTASNPAGKALLLIDTEQSPYDAWACYHRILKRAQTEEDPSWIHAYACAGHDPLALMSTLRDTLAGAAKRTGGVFAVILDGVADFVADVNDLRESKSLVARLHSLAIQYDCPIICIIHSNEGFKAGDDGRGHLGKELARKSESNLLLKKVGEVTTITSEKQRKAPITEADGVAFQWSDEEGRHITCAGAEISKTRIKKTELTDLAIEVFGTERTLRWQDLNTKIMEARCKSNVTAGRRITQMKALMVIRMTSFGLYERVT